MSSLPLRATALKRWFVMPYFGGNLAGLVHALVRVGLGGHPVAWAIAAGAHASVLAFATRSWPRRQSSLLALPALTTAASIALAAMLPGALAPFLQSAMLAAAGSLLYTTWYARFGRAPAPALAVGAKLPQLRLQTPDGGAFLTSELLGAPAALFFIRGAWCPFCSAQVRAVVAGYEELASRGVRVAMISPQPEKEMHKLADRFGVEILWLRDAGLQAAQALGIVDRGGVPAGAVGFGTDTVMPTLVVLDEEGRVIAADETDSYRIRADPQTVLSILEGDRPLRRRATPRASLEGIGGVSG